MKNRQGEESSRYIKNKTLEVENDGDKSLSIFERPRDVKGTALLNFTHKTGTDDQWLYLPALKRVKRISSANKSGSFMGSEFAFEDITSQEGGKILPINGSAMKSIRVKSALYLSDILLIKIQDIPGKLYGWTKKIIKSSKLSFMTGKIHH